MFCLDNDEKVQIQGERGSINYSNLQVVYETCKNKTDSIGVSCKNAKEQNDWISNKSILIVENEQKFQTLDYEEPIKNQTQIKLFKLSPVSNVGLNYPQLIREYDLTLSDSLMSIGLLFRETLKSFTILS